MILEDVVIRGTQIQFIDKYKPDLTEAVTVNIEFLGRLDPNQAGKKNHTLPEQEYTGTISLTDLTKPVQIRLHLVLCRLMSISDSDNHAPYPWR